MLIHSLLYLTKPFALFDARWTLFGFEYALKLTKPTQMFVQDYLIPTIVPTAEKMGLKVFTFSARRLKDLEPLMRCSRMLVLGRWLLYLPAPLRGIPSPAWCSRVGQLDPRKVSELESRLTGIDFTDTYLTS